MPQESFAKKNIRAAEIIGILERTYPDATCALKHSNPLELLISTILAAQCTDVRVNMVTPALYKRYPNAAAFAKAPLVELETMIKSTGFYHNKAKAIVSAAADIVAKHGGKVPETMEELTALRGVGRKTANVVLGNAFGQNVGIVVDTHVGRLSLRLGLTKHGEPVKVEGDLMKLVPREKWTMFAHWLIFHGRRVCMARNPQCAGCGLLGLCPEGGRRMVEAGGRKR